MITLLRLLTGLLVLLTLIIPNGFTRDTGVGIYGVVESQGEPAPYVAVFLKGTTIGTSTDANGHFNLINIPEGSHTISIQGIGYKTLERLVTINGMMLEVDFQVEPDDLLLEQVVISGSRVGVLRYLPGSASFIQRKELKMLMPISGNDALRTISGIHVVEEEGAGLRANIGIRGLDPDKSRNVLILEDGIPVALAPYGEPEMYYSPAIDRMSGIEVLKGNGSILFGPQTIGGVINYLTADPPKEQAGILSLRGGDSGYFTGMFGYGNTMGNTGVQLNYLRKQADNFGPTMFRVNDFTSKVVVNVNPRSRFNLKLGVYDENSNSTYVGLTQPMFEKGDNDYLQIAPDDRLDIRRYSLSGTHLFNMSDGFQLNTTVFGYTTTRNWTRQDFSNSSSASNQTGVIYGDETLPEGAIYLRNSTGQRNRQFEVAGIEPRLKYRYELWSRESNLDVGARLLYERAFEQRVNGTKAGVLSGNLRDDEVRTGYAFSTYAQKKMLITSNLTLTAGLRTEAIWYERSIMRANFYDTLIIAQSDVFSVIPGGGLNYNFAKNFGVFAGIHRGFAPSRIKDAISNEGIDLQLDAEKSWNAEVGFRGGFSSANEFEITAFNMNFSNQVIPVSESSGGNGAGYINGGATRHYGVEASTTISLNSIIPSQWQSSFALNSTLVNAQFSDNRYMAQKIGNGQANDPVYVNIKGNKTPYSPSILLAGSLTIESPFGLGARFSGRYTGKQFTDALNTTNIWEWIEIAAVDADYHYMQATANGRIGEIPSSFIADASLWYSLPKLGLEITACVKNAFNERYISSRRPQGIRVGMPRFISLGLNYSF